jgi:hypothetical protein
MSALAIVFWQSRGVCAGRGKTGDASFAIRHGDAVRRSTHEVRCRWRFQHSEIQQKNLVEAELAKQEELNPTVSRRIALAFVPPNLLAMAPQRSLQPLSISG